MKKFINYFLQGLLYFLPIALTLYVLFFAFQFFDNIIPINIPGLGLILLILVITLFGYLGSTVLVRPIREYVIRLFYKVPLLKLIYSSIHDIVESIFGDKKKFSDPVLVKIFANKEIKQIGFITNKDLSLLKLDEEHVMVYLPQSMSWAGMTVLVPVKDITPIDLPTADVMKCVISGGLTNLEDKEEK